VIDHADAETVDQQINRNLKRSLREAEEEVMISREVDANTFYNLCQDTFTRQKKNMPYTREFFLRLDEAIKKNNAGIKLGAINKRGQFIAVSYLLWDADTAYYFLAGDNEEGRVNAASIVLCREAIQIAFEERKVKTFDFCGSMLEPITDMRRQFGAHVVPLMKIFKAKWKLLNMMYSLK
jgi:predicted N-acyltransferase